MTKKAKRRISGKQATVRQKNSCFTPGSPYLVRSFFVSGPSIDGLETKKVNRRNSGKEVIKGLKVNSVGKTIKQLNSFLKDRMRKKVIPFIDLGAYKIMDEEVDAVYLSWQELSLIYHPDLSANSHLEKYRDLFVLCC